MSAAHHCSAEGRRSPSYELPSGRMTVFFAVKKRMSRHRLKKPRSERAVFVDASSRSQRVLIGPARRKQCGLRALIGGGFVTGGSAHAARTRSRPGAGTREPSLLRPTGVRAQSACNATLQSAKKHAAKTPADFRRGGDGLPLH